MDQKNNIDWGDWIITIIMLFAFFPVGLFLLFRQLFNAGTPKAAHKRHPYDIKREAEAKEAAASRGAETVSTNNAHREASTSPNAQNKKSSAAESRKKPRKVSIPGEISGRVLSIVGLSVSALFSVSILSTVADSIAYGWYGSTISDLLVLGIFLFGGLICLLIGTLYRRRAKLYHRYLSYIGKNTTVSIPALASAMGKRKRIVYRDLNNMLHLGVFPAGYIDMATDRLILTDEGIPDPFLQSKPEAETTPSEQDENALLLEIRAVNDAIPDRGMSEKIDRIGEITAKILDYQRSHPEKSGQLRSFLNYYLPTTLKILRAYAQLDAQGIEGENITAAKQRIENMMDQVVYGFEKQLDRLFQDDAMDITSDVEVLENMLRQDGLSGHTFGSSSTLSRNSEQQSETPESNDGGISLSI